MLNVIMLNVTMVVLRSLQLGSRFGLQHRSCATCSLRERTGPKEGHTGHTGARGGGGDEGSDHGGGDEGSNHEDARRVIHENAIVM